MRRTAFTKRIGNVVAVVALLGLLVSSVGVFFPQRVAGEPKPRPTPPAEPYIQLFPTEAVGYQDVSISVVGQSWDPNAGLVDVAWDVFDSAHFLATDVAVAADGGFQVSITVPAAWALPGEHWVVASNDSIFFARASIRLLKPTDTPTPTPSDTPGPLPPVPTTDTPTTTTTPTPSPTLRPVTPIVTGTVTRYPPVYPTQPPSIYPTQPPPVYPTATPRPPIYPTATTRPTSRATWSR